MKKVLFVLLLSVIFNIQSIRAGDNAAASLANWGNGNALASQNNTDADQRLAPAPVTTTLAQWGGVNPDLAPAAEVKPAEPQVKPQPATKPDTTVASSPPPSAKSEPRPVIQSAWTMRAGHSVGQELQVWGNAAGWKIIWNMTKDWTIPAPASFFGDFQTAASDVIKTLAANGALIRAQIYEGNKTVVVTGPGVAAQ